MFCGRALFPKLKKTVDLESLMGLGLGRQACCSPRRPFVPCAAAACVFPAPASDPAANWPSGAVFNKYMTFNWSIPTVTEVRRANLLREKTKLSTHLNICICIISLSCFTEKHYRIELETPLSDYMHVFLSF